MKQANVGPPQTLEELKSLIARRQIVFPDRLEQVARQVIERPEMVAFESAAKIARICDVSQTTVLRLAQHCGLQTFADLRSMMRNHVRKAVPFTPLTLK
ncbi:MurR/RpiR family transcriptional regulator [Rhizobium phaseoli]|jgi:DNA-binding MurR/RpiR family transcriptional regulator|uniref:MurR/RpiR family transcriptional regulator n=1 Tax=Rhizobium phaseoli TaxID=396 RepID=A0A7K3UGS3_9HYPH|nr:MurR/RpiR family transcriptional regulator [Rhizobium phaseoli]NEJ72866.1 MurR/RpiR family transcriptional regulator [Rhizobium phaseoli]